MYRKPKIINHRKQQKELEINEKLNIENILDLQIDNELDKFSEFPISTKTKNGLIDNNYLEPTSIQKSTIIKALKGLDILASAETGSGKTLAFLIPVLETLWKNSWGKEDGLGALIILPTRELAYQIFNVLSAIGKHHDFSIGLIIGGKDLREENITMHVLNVIICTPGRLLQHMNENPNFNCNDLKLLVLDEADKILEMGFLKDMKLILANLPKEKQSLLFSATQDQNVMNLSSILLKEPVTVNFDQEKIKTPVGLQQVFVEIQIEDKIDFIFNFLKMHKTFKIIVFLSTCNQVRYYEAVTRILRPGIKCLMLHGKMNQVNRISVYEDFMKYDFCVLYSTDLASRGLDFQNVDWVIQLDCPLNTVTYVHRVGRTARLKKDGKSLLVLLECERAILGLLQKHDINLYQIFYKEDKKCTTLKKLQSLCIKDNELLNKAKKAVESYRRFIKMHRLKLLSKISFNKMGTSMGLSEMDNNIDETFENNVEDDDEFLFETKEKKIKPQSFEPIITKRKKSLTKIGLAKRLLKKGIQVNERIKFNENNEFDILKASKQMKLADINDKKKERIRIKQKHGTKM